MKYFLAVLAIIGEILAYSLIAGSIGWEHGGGALMQLLMIAVYCATWRAITKKGKREQPSNVDNIDEEDVAVIF